MGSKVWVVIVCVAIGWGFGHDQQVQLDSE